MYTHILYMTGTEFMILFGWIKDINNEYYIYLYILSHYIQSVLQIFD
jgi:hypothetical protein